jgi:hypothetical protein
MIGKEKIVFDPANAAETDNVGAYIRSSDGTLITHTTDGALERLDVNWRALDYTLDSVAVKDATGNQLVINNDGSINVNADISVVNGSDKLEDAASASGDVGTYVLSVRQDALAVSTSADGDFQSFKTDDKGALWVHLSDSLPAGTNNIGSVNQGTSPWVVSGTVTANQGGTWTVGLSEDHNYGTVGANTLRTAAQIGNATGAADFGSGATTAQTLRVEANQGTSPWVVSGVNVNPTCDDELKNAAASVGTSAAVITAALANRRRIIVQNVDNSKPIYLGTSSVTTANGLRLSPGSALEIELAASASLYAIAGSNGVLARVLETGHA